MRQMKTKRNATNCSVLTTLIQIFRSNCVTWLETFPGQRCTMHAAKGTAILWHFCYPRALIRERWIRMVSLLCTSNFPARLLILSVCIGHSSQVILNSCVCVCLNWTITEEYTKNTICIICATANVLCGVGDRAAIRGDVPIMKALITAGARVNQRNSVKETPVRRILYQASLHFSLFFPLLLLSLIFLFLLLSFVGSFFIWWSSIWQYKRATLLPPNFFSTTTPIG